MGDGTVLVHDYILLSSKIINPSPALNPRLNNEKERKKYEKYERLQRIREGACLQR